MAAGAAGQQPALTPSVDGSVDASVVLSNAISFLGYVHDEAEARRCGGDPCRPAGRPAAS